MSYLERAIADGHVKLTGDGEHARLGRRWLRLAAGRLRAMRETGFETVPRGFPRGRGKLRPYRARSRLPRQYGKPEEYRFYQDAPNNDIQPVSKEALIGAIKKCHQTLWAGGKLSPLTAL